jgi:hypothetical protein
MRGKSLVTLGLMAASGGYLRADWKITTRTMVDGHQSIQTEYFKGGLRRTDQSDPGTGRLRFVTVLDLEQFRHIAWDVDSREYVFTRLHRSHSAMAATGPLIVIDRTTTDTGERQTMFGRPARRLITRERRGSQTIEIDGWYIDSDTLPRQKSAKLTGAYVMNVTGSIPTIKLNQTGPAPTGLAVWERTTITRRSASESILEVTELVEAVRTTAGI